VVNLQGKDAESSALGNVVASGALGNAGGTENKFFNIESNIKKLNHLIPY